MDNMKKFHKTRKENIREKEYFSRIVSQKNCSCSQPCISTFSSYGSRMRNSFQRNWISNGRCSVPRNSSSLIGIGN